MTFEDEVKTLKKNSLRENYFFLRRRVDKGNGKKTLGWILQDSENKTFSNPDFNKIYDIKVSLEQK